MLFGSTLIDFDDKSSDLGDAAWLIKFPNIHPCPCILYKIGSSGSSTLNRLLTVPPYANATGFPMNVAHYDTSTL